MTQKTNHLPIDTLADYVAGRLSEADVRRVEAHLAIACPTCQDNLIWLRETLTLMASSDWVSPLDSSVAAIKLAGRWQDWTHKSLEPPAQIVATVKLAARQANSEPQLLEPSAESVAAVKQAAREYNRRVEQPPVAKLKKRRWHLFRRQLRWATAMAAILALFIVGGLLYQYQQEFGEQKGTQELVQLTATQELGEQTAPLTQISGDNVLVQRAGELIPTDSPLQAGDLIQSADDSSSQLRFFDDSSATLSPNTTLSIIELSAQEKDKSQVISLKQSSGQIGYYVQPLAEAESRFEINTPAATLTVLGTTFIVEVVSNDITQLAVVEGRVDITAGGQTMLASAGEAITIQAGQSAATISIPIPSEPIKSGNWYGRTSDGEGCISFEVIESQPATIRNLSLWVPDKSSCEDSGLSIENNQFEGRGGECPEIAGRLTSITASGSWKDGTWSAFPSTLQCRVP